MCPVGAGHGRDEQPGKDVYGYTEIAEVPASELKASDPDEREAF